MLRVEYRISILRGKGTPGIPISLLRLSLFKVSEVRTEFEPVTIPCVPLSLLPKSYLPFQITECRLSCDAPQQFLITITARQANFRWSVER